MTRRSKLITLIVGLFIVLLLVLFLVLRMFKAPEPTPVEVQEPTTTTIQPSEPEESSIQRQRAEERENNASLQTLAKTFVERYGSYSNEADFQNLRDLYPLMTTAFQAQTEQFIADTTIPETYYGVTTNVITVNVDEGDETLGYAYVTLNTQREEAIDSPQNISVRYQEITLGFQYVNGSWKVSSATWK